MTSSSAKQKLEPAFFALTVGGGLIMLVGIMSVVGGPITLLPPDVGVVAIGIGFLLDLLGVRSLVKHTQSTPASVSRTSGKPVTVDRVR